MTVRDNDYKLRKASLLDIPFIFNLIQDGSLTGSFAEFNLTSKGHLTVLIALFFDVLYSHRVIKHRTDDVRLLVYTLNNEDIGFVKINSPFSRVDIQVIDSCAIKPEHRNQKHGIQMIRMVTESLPAGTNIIAHCTKYSRAMQHIFKRLKFRRDKKTNPFRLECYRFQRHETHI